MKPFPQIAFAILASGLLLAADSVPEQKRALKITPGQVIVPTDAMRRIWGELVSIDLKTRTGTFRKEGTDELMSFNVLPYAELLHHASLGDLQDFRIGARAIFRMHEAADGQWTWLTYIQDQMNMMNGHKEYFFVDTIDSEKGQWTVTQANADKSFIREKGILISTDSDTKFWKNGEPARFSDVKEGDAIRTETHGVGKGKVQMCWNVFLDDASLAKFQTAQKTLETARLAKEGAPGYVDASNASVVDLTLFMEAMDISRSLSVGRKVRLAPAGGDRQPTAPAIEGTVTAARMQGNLGKISVKLDTPPVGFEVAGLARLWAQ
jgi:hypothetical protein